MTTIALREALNDAISSGKFVDTKIVLFSRRDSAGRVYKPRALYASSHVLKSVPYFEDLLFGPFAEAEIRDFSETAGDELAEDYGYTSDSDLEEDWDFESPGSPVMPATGDYREEVPYGQYEERVLAGKVIEVQDMAFITFQAFLLYLYTNSIDFAPFGSEENRKSRSSEFAYTPRGEIPETSPKSIYRLADKYDIPELKRLALNHIQNNLHSCDIVRETFSVFTSRYDEIRSMQVRHLLSVWLSGDEEESEALHKKLDEKIDSYAAGELEHASEAVFAIWDISHKNDALPSILRARPRHPMIPRTMSIQASLIRAIQGGSLLRRKYWVRRSRGGSICPIYFPSLEFSVRFSQVDALIECYKGGDSRLENEEHEFPEDSDYESECEVEGDPVFGGYGRLESEKHEFPEGSDHESECKVEGDPASGNAEAGCERGHKPLPVLKIGSLVAWKSLIFYLWTGEIQFAPLKSQGSGRRSQWRQENTKPGAPVPCSPKTVYTLAKRLQIRPLIDLAFMDIEAKVTGGNVIETFSKFASQQSEIIAMGWKHLDAKLKTEEMDSSIREIIQGMAGGRAIHQTDALKFGLYGVLRRKGSANHSFARLRCPEKTCEAHRQPVSCPAPGNSNNCTGHEVRWGRNGPIFTTTKTMECSECGHARTDNCTWCKGCRRVFG